MTEVSPEGVAGASPELVREIVSCAERTLSEASARVELRQDWSYSGTEWRKRRRRGGLLRPLGRLTKVVVKAAWKRATRDIPLGHMVGKGILEPATGRFMIDFGSYAQIHTGDETFGGRSGRRLDTLEPHPAAGNTEDLLWVLRLVRGVSRATHEGDELLRRTPCKRCSATVDMERALTAGEKGLRVPAVDRFEDLHALPISVWIDDTHVRRVKFHQKTGQDLTVELWDFGIPTDEYNWSRLPTFRSPSEAALYAGEEKPWHRRLRQRLRTLGRAPANV
jgi:hypothetical protein